MFDIKTIFAIHSINTTLCAAVALFLWIENRNRYQGINLWLAHFSLQILSMVFFILRNTAPEFISVILSNVLYIVSLVLLCKGLALFFGKTIRQLPNWLAVIVYIPVQIYFTYVNPSLLVRQVLFSILITLIYSQCAYLALVAAKRHQCLFTQISGIVFIAYCFINIGRIGLDVAFLSAENIFASGVFNEFYFLIYQLLTMLLMFCLTLMLNRRLNADLEIDIARRKAMEEQLVAAKVAAETANQVKDEFLANISHELRTPMHQILNYSKFGETKFTKASQERLLHYFKQIRISGERLMFLLNDLLDLSKLESGRIDYEMTTTSLAQMAESIVFEFTPLIQEKAIACVIADSSLSTSVECDQFRIGQVMRNLISNALKFSPVGKSITISFGTGFMPDSKPSAHKTEANALLVKIEDEGTGVPENELETIFDKFVQSSKTKTNQGGTGLGLSICYEIISDHHGKIWAENNDKGGATLCFLLPLVQGPH